MQAMVWTQYGPPDVFELREVPTPTPGENEILIKVCAATVTAGDCEARSLKFPAWLALPMRLYVGVLKPTRVTTLGQELAGEVVEAGAAVTNFKVGDRIFGSTGFRFGAYAEYACLPADAADNALALQPNNMTCEAAATVPTGGLEALHFLRSAQLQPGEKLLINGAGGSIGTFGVQLAKYYGAQVTAVDSASKLDMLRDLGADAVIDYAQTDFTRTGDRYDVIFDIIGKSHFDRSLEILNDKGRYLLANPRLESMLRGPWATRNSSKRIIQTPASRDNADLVFLRELIEAGQLTSVIDQRYPLSELVAAHRYVETGQKAGNVVITVTGE